ncbi:MAG: ACT domain-containing protein [Deltaproteobacteria bacterium]|nr:ACT domain-containing protein [Deltaproteobacteria bacterium]
MKRHTTTSETDLAELLAGMQPHLTPGTWVFVNVPELAALGGLDPVMSFREAEGTTLVVRRSQAKASGLEGAFPCRMITLEVHWSLEAVGFLAAITAGLARLGIAVNPVSAVHHDHLFVPEDRAEEAMAELRALAAQGVKARRDAD